MNFITATEMGKKLGISYQKVNKLLAKNCLYDFETKGPTAYSLENGLAKKKSTASRFSGKTIEFTLWDFSKLEMIFPKIKKQEIEIICNRSDVALDKICDAIADFGNMLDIEPSKQTKGISKEAHKAVIESYFGDPTFLRGPLLLHRHFHPIEAETAKTITINLANELFEAARKINLNKAKHNLSAVKKTMQWLCDNTQ